MDVRHHRRAGMSVLPADVLRARKPAVAGQEWKIAQARRVLARIGGGDFADREVANIEATLVGEIEKVNFRELFEAKMFKILSLASSSPFFSSGAA